MLAQEKVYASSYIKLWSCCFAGGKKVFGSLHLSEKVKKKKKAMKDLGSRRSFSFIMWKIIFSSTTYNQNRRD